MRTVTMEMRAQKGSEIVFHGQSGESNGAATTQTQDLSCMKASLFLSFCHLLQFQMPQLSHLYYFSRAVITNYSKLMAKTTAIHFLMVLETRNPKSRCWQCHMSLKGYQGRILPCPLQLLVVQVYLGATCGYLELVLINIK